MPRFYSAEWVAAFNDAVEGLDASTAGSTTDETAQETASSETPSNHTSLVAEGGTFSVTQEVRDAPPELTSGQDEGCMAVTLVVEGGRIRLVLGRPDEAPTVTVALSYRDAVALSRGELDPAEAIGRGRIRVRGDLAVLVAAEGILARAAERLGHLQATTTY